MKRRSGQAAMELVCVLPCALVVAYILFNLMAYIALCAKFDQISSDVCIAQGASPVGSITAALDTNLLAADIQDVLGAGDKVQVLVTKQDISKFSGRATDFSLVPQFSKYSCTLQFYPLTHAFAIGQMSFSPPVYLEHTTEIVVDTYKAGVVM